MSVCLFFFAFRYSWWVLMSLHLIKMRFQFSSHDFYSGFEKNVSRQTYRQTHKALSRYVCKEWWVLVRWRVLSPLATALWTGQIANWRAWVVRVFVRVCVRACISSFFFLDCWLSCVVEDAHILRTCFHTAYTRLPVCQQVRIKCTRVCIWRFVSDS